MQTRKLELVLQALENIPGAPEQNTYLIPKIWNGGEAGAERVDPALYFSAIIRTILQKGEHDTLPDRNADWKKKAVVYNLFVRLACAFDHDADGIIGARPLENGFRETGTFLKAIALLPYLKTIGANTVYLLPLTEIGHQSRKGSLGSPYAVKNPVKLDPMLAEPALGLTSETLFGAFVEAAHLLGIHVVLEFVFRTASVDSDWAKEHPEWFYWLRDDENSRTYGPPHFDQNTLTKIYELVDRHEMQHLPAPSEEYRNLFTPPPIQIADMDGAFRGKSNGGIQCRIASAFSDWPPDDRQPAWTDVTYLKMHTHEAFNYIAYNTIRMYDAALEEPSANNSGLWKAITEIIPFYQDEYDIDGAMIDMGHALPKSLKMEIACKARQKRPDFLFWDENFDPTPSIRDEGVDAVFGSLPFVINDIIYIRGLLNYLNKTGVALPFFGTGENHNTPRLCFRHPCQEAGRNFSIFIFTLAAVLPSIPFIHSGMELCEWHPVNLGLNFTEEDRKKYSPDNLPLFSASAYDWKNTNTLEPLNGYIRQVLEIRERFLDIILSGEKGSIIVPYVSHPELFAVMRTVRDRSLLFIGNSNVRETRTGTLEFSGKEGEMTDMIGEKTYAITDHKLEVDCRPGQCMLFELPSEI
ncbi:MAG: alpha-amylase [Chlorobiaceae bacterium]|nr:alpha-amylase [Chlorobiaceae bacterium]NTV61607.1 alpha-amylase [Chlorobiaceae bacterium]